MRVRRLLDDKERTKGSMDPLEYWSPSGCMRSRMKLRREGTMPRGNDHSKTHWQHKPSPENEWRPKNKLKICAVKTGGLQLFSICEAVSHRMPHMPQTVYCLERTEITHESRALVDTPHLHVLRTLSWPPFHVHTPPRPFTPGGCANKLVEGDGMEKGRQEIGINRKRATLPWEGANPSGKLRANFDKSDPDIDNQSRTHRSKP